MNTLIACLAVPAYVLVGLLVVALVESADKPMSDAELWGCVLLWPIADDYISKLAEEARSKREGGDKT